MLTPAGRGAIATVAVRGAGAVALVARRFLPAARTELAAFAIGRVVFGRFRTSEATTEELVVGLLADDAVEIHCHGGKAAVEAICAALVAEGCALVSPDQWIEAEEAEPLAAQALLALADARTERAAAILLDQYRGALRAELTSIERLLEQGNSAAAASALDQLLVHADVGLHLTRAWKVVIAGRPNAGKSSLMNALLGYQRSIVWQEPGTTRDVLTATTALDGWLVELSDTAGLRIAGDSLEAAGVARAERQIAAADLVIFVADAMAVFDNDLYRNIGRPGGRTTLLVHNKCDLARGPADGRPAGLETSATTGAGIENLCQSIVQTLVPEPPPRGAPIPFTPEQVAALQAAKAELDQGNSAAARQQLTRLIS